MLLIVCPGPQGIVLASLLVRFLSPLQGSCSVMPKGCRGLPGNGSVTRDLHVGQLMNLAWTWRSLLCPLSTPSMLAVLPGSAHYPRPIIPHHPRPRTPASSDKPRVPTTSELSKTHQPGLGNRLRGQSSAASPHIRLHTHVLFACSSYCASKLWRSPQTAHDCSFR